MGDTCQPQGHRRVLTGGHPCCGQGSRTRKPACLSISLDRYHLWLLLCSRPRSQKHPREKTERCGWGCCGAGIACQGQNLGCPCWWQWPSASSWMELRWALRREQPCSCLGSVYLQHGDRKRMQKACFLQGKCSSRVAPVLLPLPPADPLVSGFPLGRLKGHRVPSPPALPGAQPGPACPASLRHTLDTLDTQPCVDGYRWLW